LPTWDPDLYERHKAYRDRPALDLLTQIPRDLNPREAWDLGCGTGEIAAVLAQRFPRCAVHGLDSSPRMLERARVRAARVDWVEGDIAAFAPDKTPDLIFTNAALQWVPDHEALFPRLVATLAPGGVFACQIPVQYEMLHHRVIRETAAEGPWAQAMAGARAVEPSLPMARYYDWLSPLAASVDLWTTEYIHVLEGADPVLEWLSGTSLLPYTGAVESDPDLKAEFLAALAARLREAFPLRSDGATLLPFQRRFFLVRSR
jgi:trans-aconitate 2-methyltransferase